MLSWQIILYIVSSGMFFSLLSVGFGLTLRSVKFFNLAYGGAFLVGGYTMFWLYRTLSISFLPSLVISGMTAGFYLLLTYQFVFKILFHRKAKNLVLLIASLGLLTATSAILGMIFGNQPTIIARHLSDIGVIDIFGGTLNIVEAVIVATSLLVIPLLAYVRSKTRFGRATRAIEDDIEVAELVGIPKEKTLKKIFFVSGVCAGLGGIMLGFNVGIIPASGLIYMLPTIVAVVIGGMQSFWGGVLGAFVLTLAQQLTIVVFGGSWVQAVPFIILIVMLLVRPAGILKR